MTPHPDEGLLNDYAEGKLGDATRADVETHLERCVSCRDIVHGLSALLGAAREIPASVDAPAGAWSAIQMRIDREKVVTLHAGRPAIRSRRWYVTAAAAVILVVASSGITALFMTGRSNNLRALAADTAQSVAIPLSLVNLERGYIDTVNELTTALDASRGALAPETIRAVERSLRVIDNAIAEARAALITDPASNVLRDMLSNTYKQKVELLRRTAERARTS